MENNEFSLADHELRIYVIVLSSLNDLKQQISDLRAELNYLDSSTVSSPKIKSSEEAKYKDPPKVYMEDAPIQIIARKDDLTQRIQILQDDLKEKITFCRIMANKISCLSEEEKELLNYRYFEHKTLRQLGEMYYCNKDTIQRRLNSILARF